MKIGFFAPHVGEGSTTAGIDRACALVDELGADSIWAVDHIAFPYGFKAVYPYATHQFGESPDKPLEWWDCLSVLSYLAARTERVQIATGVLILPYRHPVATAKAIATIDVLSGGRVLFGAGVGWLEDEFEALQLEASPTGARSPTSSSTSSGRCGPRTGRASRAASTGSPSCT
jgi:alkanesulfonate monooxygenase SsuD/methylene tetrahydromethanopterin reductase-like flavin-dependent oxidoreductase (luciferase family)